VGPSNGRHETGNGNSGSDEDDGRGDRALQHALEQVGYGRWQSRLLLPLTGLTLLADALELMLLPFLTLGVECEWGRADGGTNSFSEPSQAQSTAADRASESIESSLLSTSVFVGMLVGALLSGLLADHFGRRPAVLFFTAVTGLAGLGSALAPGPRALLLSRAAVGIGVGGTPAALSLFTEWLPRRNRGAHMISFMCYFSAGAVLSVLLAWAVLERTGWRGLLFCSAIPALMLFGVAYALLPESPAWLLARSGSSSDPTMSNSGYSPDDDDNNSSTGNSDSEFVYRTRAAALLREAFRRNHHPASSSLVHSDDCLLAKQLSDDYTAEGLAALAAEANDQRLLPCDCRNEGEEDEDDSHDNDDSNSGSGNSVEDPEDEAELFRLSTDVIKSQSRQPNPAVAEEGEERCRLSSNGVKIEMQPVRAQCDADRTHVVVLDAASQDDGGGSNNTHGGFFSPIRLVFSPSLRRISMQLCALFFLMALVYYMLVLLSLSVLQERPSTGNGVATTDVAPVSGASDAAATASAAPAAPSSSSCHLDSSQFVSLLLSNLAEFPGLWLALVLLERWGRRSTIATMFLLTAVSVAAMPLVWKANERMCTAAAAAEQANSSGDATTAAAATTSGGCPLLPSFAALQSGLLFVSRAAALAFNQSLWIFTAELYPASVRSSGLGITTVFARLGGMASPWLADYVFWQVSRSAAAWACVAAALLAALLAQTMPRDTKGQNLGLHVQQQQQGQRQRPQRHKHEEQQPHDIAPSSSAYPSEHASLLQDDGAGGGTESPRESRSQLDDPKELRLSFHPLLLTSEL
jgi:MFS family permease